MYTYEQSVKDSWNTERRLRYMKTEWNFEYKFMEGRLPKCQNDVQREIMKKEIELVKKDKEDCENLLIGIGVEPVKDFRFDSNNWNDPENTYEYRKQFKMLRKRHHRYTVKLWEEKQNKIEWDERMNGEPNYFYDLLPDLKEDILDKVYRSCFNECMKQLLTVKIRDNHDLYILPAHERYDVSYKTISLVPWLLYNDNWVQRDFWIKDRRTETSTTDLKDYLKENGFKVTTKMTKTELIRLCLSF